MTDTMKKMEGQRREGLQQYAKRIAEAEKAKKEGNPPRERREWEYHYLKAAARV